MTFFPNIPQFPSFSPTSQSSNNMSLVMSASLSVTIIIILYANTSYAY